MGWIKTDSRNAKQANIVDWVFYGAVITVAFFVHNIWDHSHWMEMRHEGVNTTELAITYAIARVGFWLAVLLTLGMIRIRILLRDIRIHNGATE